MDSPKDAVASEIERLGGDFLWMSDGRPYYNVHPDMVEHLANCRFGDVPSTSVEIPGGFDVVLLRFAGAHPLLTVGGDEYVRAIRISRVSVGRSLSLESMAELLSGVRPKECDEPLKVIRMDVDLGERSESGRVQTQMDWVVGIELKPDATLAELFNKAAEDQPAKIGIGTKRREVLEHCLRLVAAVGFLADCTDDNLIQFDVLARHRKEFLTANKERRDVLIRKARQKGKHGWNIGTNEMVLGEMPTWSTNGETGEGSGHSHAHIRTGHLHAVRFGPGRKEVKLKWFRPTVVRSDLPFQPNTAV